MTTTIFKNREEAGKELASKLAQMDILRPVVFAVPRGGVPVAFQIAKALNAPLDTVISRKLGMRADPEFSFGAIAPGDVVMLNASAIDSLDIVQEEIDSVLISERLELERRMEIFKSGRFIDGYEYDTAIIVDDGLATGMCAAAAVESVKLIQKPRRIIFASPVCSQEALKVVRKALSDIVCLNVPEYFLAVGQWYERFNQVSDDEVLYLIHTAHDARTFSRK